MIDFEDLARKKQKELLIVCSLLVCLCLLVYFHVMDNELIVSCVFFALAIYACHCLPYSTLLNLLKISKKVSAKIQRRTEILQAMNLTGEYSCEVEAILHYPFFLKEQEFQNNVDEILENSSLADKDKEKLKEVQREINALLRAYKFIAERVLVNYFWWNKYFYRDIDPIKCFFTEEDINFFK